VRHVILHDPGGDRWLDPRAYLAALPGLTEQLPPGARAFATEPGHYDFHSTHCVKDLQPTTARTGPDGALDLYFGHNCWKHDDDLTLRYTAVRAVSGPGGADTGADALVRAWGKSATVTLDELLPADDGLPGVRHEIGLLADVSGRTELAVLITAADVVATWTPAGCCG
jgi:hypothetical protein